MRFINNVFTWLMIIMLVLIIVSFAMYLAPFLLPVAIVGLVWWMIDRAFNKDKGRRE